MKKTMSSDFTSGNIWQKMLLFVLPILAGNLLQQLYTTVDAIVIGQYTGKEGLSAIDAVYGLLRLPVVFFVGLSTGATLLISRYFGAKDGERQRRATHTAVLFALAGGVLLSLAGMVSAPLMLRRLAVPAELYSSSLQYVQIYFAGFLFLMTYNIGAGILRAVGNSKAPFYILVFSSLLNILLDLLFVAVFRWNIAGAAGATLLSQLVSSVGVLVMLARSDTESRLRAGELRADREALGSMLRLGIPIALQGSLYPIANMIVQASINATGMDNIAAWALCGKLDFLIWVSLDSMSAAVATFASQNYGSKNAERIRRGTGIGLGMTAGVVLFLSAILYFFTGSLGKFFLPPKDYGVLPIAVRIMWMAAPFYVCCAFGDVLSGSIRGTGDSIAPMAAALFTICGARIFWVWVVVPMNPSFLRIILGYPATWALHGAVTTLLYLRHRRKLRRALAVPGASETVPVP